MEDWAATGEWFTSTFSASVNCVAVRIDHDGVLVRHSKGLGDVISFTRSEWLAFITGVKAGEFDLPEGA